MSNPIHARRLRHALLSLAVTLPAMLLPAHAQEQHILTAIGAVDSFEFSSGYLKTLVFQSRPQTGEVGTEGSIGVRQLGGAWSDHQGSVRWIVERQAAIRSGAVPGGRYLFSPGTNGIVRYTQQAATVAASVTVLCTSGQGGLWPAAGFATSDLMSAGDRVFWGEADQGKFQIWSHTHELGGVNLCHAEVFQAFPAGMTLKKLAPLNSSTALALTSSGLLFAFRYDDLFVALNGPSGMELLASGVTDFASRRETYGNVPLDTVYFTVGHTLQAGGPPSALRRRARSSITGIFGAATAVYSTGVGVSGEFDTLLEVAADSQHLFLRRVPVSVFAGYLFPDEQSGFRATLRADTSAAEPLTIAAFAAIPADGKNLRSDEKHLYYQRSDAIYRVPADVAPLPVVNLDFEAVAVEITQGTQTLDHRVDLISGKRTFVRGYAKERVNTGTGMVGFQPRARLRVYWRPLLPAGAAETELTATPLLPINAPKLPESATSLSLLRLSAATSYLWELPASMTNRGFGSMRVAMELLPEGLETRDPDNLPLNPADNNMTASLHLGGAPGVRFIPMVEPSLLFIPIKTHGEYYTNRELAAENLGPFLNRAVSQLPVRNLRSWVASDLMVTSPFGNSQPLNIEEAQDWALHLGIGWMNMWHKDPPGSTDTHWVGVVHDRAQVPVLDPVTFSVTYRWSNFNGLANFGESSIVAFRQNGPTATNTPWGGRTLAHELGHNWDQEHVDCENPDSPDLSYPYDPCWIGPGISNLLSERFGFDPITGMTIMERSAGDLMSYAPVRWISDHTWARLITEIYDDDGPPGAFPSPARAPRAGIRRRDGGPAAYFLLNAIYRAADGMASLMPVCCHAAADVSPAALQRSLDAASGVAAPALRWRQKDGAGATLAETPAVLEVGHDSGDEMSGIAQFVEADPSAVRLELVEVATNRVVAGAAASAHAPTATLAEPQIDPTNQRLRISWSAADADGDELLFTLLYDRGDGAVQRVIRSQTRELSADIDLTLLPAAADGFLRLVVSDGFHSAIANSTGFTVPEHAPTLLLSGLLPGQRLDCWEEGPAAPRVVTAQTMDIDDGPLHSADAVQWSWTGPESGTATGASITVGKWTPGEYTLSAGITDSGGLAATVTLPFQILAPLVPEAPSMVLEGIMSGADYRGAPHLAWALSDGRPASARLSHRDGALFVCIEGMALAAPGQFAGIMIDVDGSGSAGLQADDLAVEVFPDGNVAIWSAQNEASWMRAEAPPSLIEAAVFAGEAHWSTEVRFPDSVIGGWNHQSRIRLYVGTNGQYPYDCWPPGSDHHGPATWSPVSFGPRPAAAPQAPIARAAGSGSFAPTATETFTLDGTGSSHADGQTAGLTYLWTQTGGPPVELADATSANTSFTKAPAATPATLTFELVVNDGNLSSPPSAVTLYFYPPPALTPLGAGLAKSGGAELNRLPDGTVEGCFDANFWFRKSAAGSGFSAAGAFFTVETTTDLTNWLSLQSGPASLSGLVRFTDPTAVNDPVRFYRLRQ